MLGGEFSLNSSSTRGETPILWLEVMEEWMEMNRQYDCQKASVIHIYKTLRKLTTR